MKYVVKYNVADQELEKVLNEQKGYTVYQMFRNKTSEGGVETSTIIFRHQPYTLIDGGIRLTAMADTLVEELDGSR